MRPGRPRSSRGWSRSVALAITRAVVATAAAAALAVTGLARGADLPGTPQPSRDTPRATPGQTDVFGTEGDQARKSRAPAEREAAERRDLLEHIEVAGNRQVAAAAIRSKLAVKPGEPLTPEAVSISRDRLLQLGTLSRVDMTTTPGSEPGWVVLRVMVEERAPVIVSDFMLGHTAVSPLYGSLGIADPSVPGLGLGVSVAAALDGQGRRAGKLTLYDPDLQVGGRSWIAGMQAIWQEGLESGCATPRCDGRFSAIPWLRYRRIGGEIDAGWRPRAFRRILFGYRLELLDGASDPGVVAAARPDLREGRSRLSALVFGYDTDTRTDPFLPPRGSRFEVRVTLGTAALGSDYEYTKCFMQVEHWFPQRGGRALRLDFALGLVQGAAPFFERFYAADWSYFSVGVAASRALDLNFSPDSRYDVLLAVLGGEYDLPLWDAPRNSFRRGFLALGCRFLYSAARADAGRSALSATPVSIDAALRIDTRLGVITIRLGYVVDQVLKVVPLNVPGVQRR